MTTFLPANALSVFLQTFRNFEGDELQLKILLNNAYRDTAYAVNVREISLYDEVEVQTGQQFFTEGNAQKKRLGFRRSFPFGNIAAGGTLVIPHGITGITNLTHISGGVITDAPDFRPLPYPSVTANANIEVLVDNTDITINVGASSPNIISGIVVIEYLKN